MLMIYLTLTEEFISYYPLKQGLKLTLPIVIPILGSLFISYYPLKQGLKH